MKKISNLLGKAISACLFTFIAVLVGVTFLQVLCRFVIKIPVPWTEEVVRMSFVWLIFLGSAIATKEGSHLVLDMVTNAVGPRTKISLQYLVLSLILVLSGVILYAGVSYCLRSATKTAVTIPIPANIVYSAVPISALLMIFFTVEIMINKITGGKGEGK